MNTKVKIISPRPMRNKEFSLPINRSNKTNNSKFICPGIIGYYPFHLYSNNKQHENQKKNLVNKSSITSEIIPNDAITNSATNFSPITISHIDEDFFDFKSNLTMLIEENDAKSEILSILSTDLNDSNVSRNDIRSSMPPLRPVNPILKKLDIEDSADIPLIESSNEILFTNSFNSYVHN